MFPDSDFLPSSPLFLPASDVLGIHGSHHDPLHWGAGQMEFLCTGKQKPTFYSSSFLPGLSLPPVHILPSRNNRNELGSLLPLSGRQAACYLCSWRTWNHSFPGSSLSSILDSFILCINTFPLGLVEKAQVGTVYATDTMDILSQCSSDRILPKAELCSWVWAVRWYLLLQTRGDAIPDLRPLVLLPAPQQLSTHKSKDLSRGQMNFPIVCPVLIPVQKCSVFMETQLSLLASLPPCTDDLRDLGRAHRATLTSPLLVCSLRFWSFPLTCL